MSPDEASALEAELARELPESHALKGRALTAHARRDDCDDVAFRFDDGSLCVVHLTWAVETDPRWPRVAYVTELEEDEDLEPDE